MLDLTLPYVADSEVETMIDQRTTSLMRQLDAERGSQQQGQHGGGGRGQITVQFLDRKRRKGWLMRGDEEVPWEYWTVKVTVAEPRTESGGFSDSDLVVFRFRRRKETDGGKPHAAAAVEPVLTTTLRQSALKSARQWSRPSSPQ